LNKNPSVKRFFQAIATPKKLIVTQKILIATPKILVLARH
jgi:hypothetical protein